MLDMAAPSLSNKICVLTLVSSRENPFRLSSSILASHLPYVNPGVSLFFLERSGDIKSCWGMEQGGMIVSGNEDERITAVTGNYLSLYALETLHPSS